MSCSTILQVMWHDAPYTWQALPLTADHLTIMWPCSTIVSISMLWNKLKPQSPIFATNLGKFRENDVDFLPEWILERHWHCDWGVVYGVMLLSSQLFINGHQLLIAMGNKSISCQNKSFRWGSKYARGLVVLNKINIDRTAHLWWGIL